MIQNDIFKTLSERADLTEERDLDRLWTVVTEMVSPSTVATSERIERAVGRCYAARTRLVRNLTEKEVEGATGRKAESPADATAESDLPRFGRQEDLRPEHLAPFKLRAARTLARQLNVPESWIVDLRKKMARQRQTDQKIAQRAAKDARNAAIASVR
ncbi:hypothetical protein [Rathayibacter sp. AY1A3]|uniref:hypothetical protein n=1 Tax=Rathayibacter sp. AY1A3 TaxID=2080521 RepID=UPI0011AFE335|nr:hypothetical protein [Rathayibacter sp. AY1A3]